MKRPCYARSRRRHEVICAQRRRLSRVATRWKRDVQAIEVIHERAVNFVLTVMRRCRSFGAAHQLKVAWFAPMLLQQSVYIFTGIASGLLLGSVISKGQIE